MLISASSGEQVHPDGNKWIKCEDELPDMGMPVLAICHDGSSQAIPKVVCRLDTDHGWSWNSFGNHLPVYADNQAYFNYWMQIPEVPES